MNKQDYIIKFQNSDNYIREVLLRNATLAQARKFAEKDNFQVSF